MKHLLLWISIGLFVLSCCSKVFIFEEGNSSFLFGLICLLFGFEHLSWYANPALFTAWVLCFLKKYRLAIVFAAMAFLLGFAALNVEEVPRDSSGTKTRVLGFHIGYYLWMSAHLAALLFSVWRSFSAKNEKKRTTQDPAASSNPSSE